MKLYRVSDIQVSEVLEKMYDLALFASGYEERCTHIARRLAKERIANTIVLGFKEINHNEQRFKNDLYFAEFWSNKQVELSTNDDGAIYTSIQQVARHSVDKLHILVDYSSMSRLWYAGVLNWARFALGIKEIIIDFVYAVGDHSHFGSPMVITDFLCIPGCEGGAVPIYKSVAVFGLGFEGLAALCVLDRLEPDEVYVYLANPAAYAEYTQKTESQNIELINQARAKLELPLTSVENTFRHLAELISPHRSKADITFIPMGPKPHVLAAILLSLRFEEVACLRVSGKRDKPEDVGTTGEIVATRVHFKIRQPKQISIINKANIQPAHKT
ncbi:MAG TPA: hypothetical protein VF131_22940 [Blastocatellia bacterium]|nr:hypothetical protein [Blastocatellia bacterium]